MLFFILRCNSLLRLYGYTNKIIAFCWNYSNRYAFIISVISIFFCSDAFFFATSSNIYIAHLSGAPQESVPFDQFAKSIATVQSPVLTLNHPHGCGLFSLLQSGEVLYLPLSASTQTTESRSIQFMYPTESEEYALGLF